MRVSLKIRLLIVAIATLVISIGFLWYGSTESYREEKIQEEKVLLTEAFDLYKTDPNIGTVLVNNGKIPIKEGKRIVAVVSQGLPERISIEYDKGKVKMKELSKDPWGNKYSIEMTTNEENILTGFVIKSRLIEVSI